MRAAYIPVMFLHLAIAGLAADKPPKSAPAPKAPPAPKAQAKANPGGRGMANVPRPIDEQIERLSKMPPAQREKALANVPPDRRAKIEAGLAHWDKVSPQLKAEYEKFSKLPPETKKRIRQLSQEMAHLPPQRKIAVQKELDRLRAMPEEQREKRLNSPAVQRNFSPNEQEILREAPSLLPETLF
jgi:hypothetical protein